METVQTGWARPAGALLPEAVASCLGSPLQIRLMPGSPFVTPQQLSDPNFASTLSSPQRRRVLIAAFLRLRRHKELSSGEWRLSYAPLNIERGWLGDPAAETIWRTYRLPTDPSEVFGAPPGALIRKGGITARRFVRIISAIEARYGLQSMARRFSGLPTRISNLVREIEEGRLSWHDIRLAGTLEKLQAYGKNPGQALTGIPGLATGRVSLAHLEAIERIESCVSMNVTEEIEDLVHAVTTLIYPRNPLRNARMLCERFSATDEEGNSLKAIGDRFSVSGERIRQIAAKVLDVVREGPAWTPSGDRLLRLLEGATPAPLSLLQGDARVMDQLGSSASVRAFLRFRADAEKSTSGLVCRQASAPLVNVAIGREEDFRLASVVHSAAIKLAAGVGAINISLTAGFASELLGAGIRPATAERMLQLDPAFQWLDQAQGWGWFGPEYPSRLLNQLQKIFSAIPAGHRIETEELHAAISRETRTTRTALGDVPSLPPNILKLICRQLPNLDTWQSDDFSRRHVADESIGAGLGGVERAIFDFAVARGGVFSRAALTKHLMPTLQYSLRAYSACLAWSPVFDRVEQGIFKIVGWPLDIQALLEARKERGLAGTLSESYSGVMPNPSERPACDSVQVSFPYLVGPAAFNARQVHIPSTLAGWFLDSPGRLFVSDQLLGARVRLSSTSPSEARLQGLASVFNALGVKVGDQVRITARRDGSIHIDTQAAGSTEELSDLDGPDVVPTAGYTSLKPRTTTE